MNANLFLIALYDVLGELWEDYKLPATLNPLWEQVDKNVNSQKINWELFRKENHDEYLKIRSQLEECYNY